MMKAISRVRAMTAIPCLLALMVIAGPTNRAPARRFVIFSLADTWSVGEPVILSVDLFNDTSQPITVDLGDNGEGAFHFRITQPNGNSVECPQQAAKRGLVFSGLVDLAPGELYSTQVTLNECSDFSRLGDYVVDGDLENQFRGLDGTTLASKRDFRLNFTLVGRDVKRLRETCERLATRVLNSSSARERLEAARALSYASDPEAVPYLQKVLKASIASEFAIDGLRRVGSLEAVRALIETAKTNTWEAKMAKSALREVQANTTNPQIQREIEASAVRLQ